jgi:hypothetical protein
VGFFWGVLFNIFLVRGHFGCAKRTHRQDRFYTNVVSAAKRTGPNRDHTKNFESYYPEPFTLKL